MAASCLAEARLFNKERRFLSSYLLRWHILRPLPVGSAGICLSIGSCSQVSRGIDDSASFVISDYPIGD